MGDTYGGSVDSAGASVTDVSADVVGGATSAESSAHAVRGTTVNRLAKAIRRCDLTASNLKMSVESSSGTKVPGSSAVVPKRRGRGDGESLLNGGIARVAFYARHR